MLSYDLIRMGSIIKQSNIRSFELLKLVSDNTNLQARNFLTNVIIIEIDKTSGESQISMWPIHECGSYIEGIKKKKEFVPDTEQSIAYPFILPSGGNPLQPQGRYPVANYPIYDAQFKQFSERASVIETFISSRVKRTSGLILEEADIKEIAALIKNKLNQDNSFLTEKRLGLMVLVFIDGKNSPYFYSDNVLYDKTNLLVGESKIYPGKYVKVNMDKIIDQFWDAKFEEGIICGSKDKGICTICGQFGPVVSGYNKSLYWFPITWEAPLSFGNDKNIVKSIALCKECYCNLTVGADLFGSLSSLVDSSLVKEVFAPVSSAVVKNRIKMNTADNIYGSMIVLPLLDTVFENRELANEWIEVLQSSMDKSILSELRSKKSRKARHLDNITGFKSTLPEDWANEDFRLTLIYFSGEPTKLNIYLRAIIEDILPPIAEMVQDLMNEVVEEINNVMNECTVISEQSIERKKKQIQSLPYLLASAFGAAHVWTTMQKVFKGRNIDKQLFIKNISLRMNQEAKLLPDSIFNLQQESVEYFAINSFLDKYNTRIAGQKGGENTMKSVKELINLTWEIPVEEMRFESIDELGFAAGQIVQRFGKSYYEGNNHKDFIKHRILTFGSSLTPEVIRNKALGRMEEYIVMLDLKVSPDVLKRAAVVSMNFVKFEKEINLNKDRFMAAFWAGYSLGRKKRDENKQQQEGEE